MLTGLSTHVMLNVKYQGEKAQADSSTGSGKVVSHLLIGGFPMFKENLHICADALAWKLCKSHLGLAVGTSSSTTRFLVSKAFRFRFLEVLFFFSFLSMEAKWMGALAGPAGLRLSLECGRDRLLHSHDFLCFSASLLSFSLITLFFICTIIRTVIYSFASIIFAQFFFLLV